MPTPDEELDLLLQGAEDTLPTAPVPPQADFAQPAPQKQQTSDADAEIDALLAQEDEPVATDRIGHGESMPVQLIESQPEAAGQAYTRGVNSEIKPGSQTAQKENEPWYKVLGETTNDAVAGLSHGATMHMDSLLNEATRKRTAEARARSPITFAVTDTVGGVVPSIAMTGAGLVGEAGKGAANFLSRTGAAGLQGMAQGAGLGIGNAGPDATAEERALAAVKSANLGGAASAAISGAGEGLGKLAVDAKKKAAEYLTHVFMTPAQRAGYVAVKGPDALSKLGRQAEDAGMFKPREFSDRFMPINARRVAENADRVRATAGPAIGQFEDQYVKGSSAEVPVGDIANALRRKAANVGQMIDTDAPADARVMSQLADRIDQPTTAPVSGEFTEFPQLREAPPPKPMPPLPPRPAPEQLTFVPDRTPGPPMVRPVPVQQSLPLQPEPEQLVMSVDPGDQLSLGFPQTRLPGNRLTPPKQTTIAQNQPFDSAAWKGPKPAPEPVPPQAEQLGFGPQQMTLREVPAKPTAKELWTPGSLDAQQTDLGVATIQKTPLAAEATLTRDAMPLEEAVANKRNIGDRIDWSKKRADQTTYGQEAARKYTWGELSDRITNALQDEVARGKIPASAMAQYKKNMADFSTAATVHDPALKMAERHGQIGLGLTDLLTASAVGGGPAGGLAALTSRATRGMAPASAARTAKLISGAAEFGAGAAAVGKRVAPQLTAIEEAQQQAPEGASKYEIEEAANRRLKSQIHGLEPLLKGPQ